MSDVCFLSRQRIRHHNPAALSSAAHRNPVSTDKYYPAHLEGEYDSMELALAASPIGKDRFPALLKQAANQSFVYVPVDAFYAVLLKHAGGRWQLWRGLIHELFDDGESATAFGDKVAALLEANGGPRGVWAVFQVTPTSKTRH